MTNASHIVYVVDDDPAVRQSTCFILSTRGIRSRPFVSGVDFLAEVEALEPGCLLLDVRMPAIPGPEVQTELALRQIDLPTIVMTGHGDVSTAVRVMKLGAIDFLEKPFADETLFATLERAFALLEDRRTATEQIDGALRRIGALSPRETDVLRGLVAGLPNKIIAHRLGLSPRTVEMHRAKMMTKLGLRSLPDVLRLAFRAGVPPLDGQGGYGAGLLRQELAAASPRLPFRGEGEQD